MAYEIEKNKDRLIDGIEKKLNQSLQQQDLFTIKWKLI